MRLVVKYYPRLAVYGNFKLALLDLPRDASGQRVGYFDRVEVVFVYVEPELRYILARVSARICAHFAVRRVFHAAFKRLRQIQQAYAEYLRLAVLARVRILRVAVVAPFNAA